MAISDSFDTRPKAGAQVTDDSLHGGLPSGLSRGLNVLISTYASDLREVTPRRAALSGGRHHPYSHRLLARPSALGDDRCQHQHHGRSGRRCRVRDRRGNRGQLRRRAQRTGESTDTGELRLSGWWSTRGCAWRPYQAGRRQKLAKTRTAVLDRTPTPRDYSIDR